MSYADLSSRSGGIFEKFLKSSFAKANFEQLAENQLAATEKATIGRAARQKTAGRVIQKGGVVTVEKARE